MWFTNIRHTIDLRTDELSVNTQMIKTLEHSTIDIHDGTGEFAGVTVGCENPDGTYNREGTNLAQQLAQRMDYMPDYSTGFSGTWSLRSISESLAKELVEETAADFDFNLEDSTNSKLNMNNVFQKMFKNPGKLMNLVKNVGKKIDDKFKSGDIKESELLQEASDLLSQMKGMPGMNNLSNLFSQMGMGDMGNLASMMSAMGGGKGKMNIGAMQSHLQQNMKQAKMKERMHQKLEQKKQNSVSQTVSQSAGLKNNTLQGQIEQSKLMMQQLQQTEQQLLSDFEIDNIQNSIVSSNKNNSNNNKKKKSKK